MKLLTYIWNFIKSPGPMAVVAIGGVAFGVYGTLFYERQAALTIELISNNPVFDIRTDVSKLGVTYAGVDLRRSSQTLRLFSVKIANTGSKDILKTDFDEGEPISLVVSDGKVVEISRIIASNDFLQRRGQVKLLAESSIQVNPVLLEKNEYMNIDFLVLSDLGKAPSVKAGGKIAGIKHFDFIENPVAPKVTLISDVFHSETLAAQILRGPPYFILFFFEALIIGMVVALPLIASQAMLNAVRRFFRERVVRKKFFGKALSDVERVALEYYIDRGTAGLSHIYRLLDRIEQRNKALLDLPEDIPEHDQSKYLSNILPVSKKEIASLKNENVIVVNGLKIDADPEFEDGVDNVCRRLQLDPEHIRVLDDESRFGSITAGDEIVEMSMISRDYRSLPHRAPADAGKVA